MNPVFADTSFFLALLNIKDPAHEKASSFEGAFNLITTTWVMIEVGDALSTPNNRQMFSELWTTLNTSPDAEILPPDETALAGGLELFKARQDKFWSLTDCLSFQAMRAFGLTEALTTDHHFQQAGFIALLR